MVAGKMSDGVSSKLQGKEQHTGVRRRFGHSEFDWHSVDISAVMQVYRGQITFPPAMTGTYAEVSQPFIFKVYSKKELRSLSVVHACLIA